MAVQNDGLKAFTSGEALAVYRRVKLDSSGLVVYAGADEAAIGITQEAVASGYSVTVKLLNSAGTFKMTCGAAVAARVPVYGLASGKIDDVVSGSNGSAIGIALEAGSGDGSVIEVLPIPAMHGTRVVFGTHTTVAAADTVVTGLAVVLMVIAGWETLIADANYNVQAQKGDQAGTPAAGSIVIRTFKTDGTDPTPVAADAFSKLVNWIAIGY